MLIINAADMGIEKALKVLKRKTAQTGLIKELRSRQEYTKPSVRRREEIKKAVHRDAYNRGSL